MINTVVVNGCSYMECYVQGMGHHDLAARLGIDHAHSLAIGGSANSRILRTTLKHSHTATAPTFYVLGMTFVSREEIPIMCDGDEFEGAWTNPQNQQFRDRWVPHWSDRDTEKFVSLKLKYEMCSVLDRTEDLMYRMLAAISLIRSRGHRVLMFQQADDLYQEFLSHPRLCWFKNQPEIVEGYAWASVPWQHQKGVQPLQYAPGSPPVPPEITHRRPGHHDLVNEFLTDWIKSHKLLT
jgi:hypothetical protein